MRGGKIAKNKSGAGNQPKPKSKGDGTKAKQSDSKGSEKQHPPMSEAQKRAIENLAGRRGLSETETQKMVLDTYGYRFEHMSSQDASECIRTLQKTT